VTFTQEQLEAAYEQMRQARITDKEWGRKAAQKLESLVGWKFVERKEGSQHWSGNWGWGWGHDVHPHHTLYELAAQACQYDDWRGIEDALNACCKQVDAPGVWTIIATFDVSQFPEFAESHQKEFKVYVEYYDSHFSGY
jgi:hypothetical protein